MESQMTVPAGWLTIKQVAERTKYHPMYVRKLCVEGKIEAKQIGRQWFVDPKSANDYKKAQEQRRTEIAGRKAEKAAASAAKASQ